MAFNICGVCRVNTTYSTVDYSSMQQLSCDSCQAFKQWSRNSRTTQYPPTSPYTSHIGVQHHTFPAVDLVECTSHITPPLQHRCLTSWRKLPQYKTFPLASVLHINPSLSLVPSFSLPLCLSHTNTHRQREIKTTPPTPTSPQLLPGDTRWSLECTQNIAICRERPCSTMRQPRGQQERPAALHRAEHPSPSKLASPGRFYLLSYSRLLFLRMPALKSIFSHFYSIIFQALTLKKGGKRVHFMMAWYLEIRDSLQRFGSDIPKGHCKLRKTVCFKWELAKDTKQ